MAQGLVQTSASIEPAAEIDGPGICGLHHPFKVRGLAEGTVLLSSAAILDCSMIPALDNWIKTAVEPAALARFGEPVVEIRTMGAYNCRGINNARGANLSEHAFGNAIDIGSFVLRSGRTLNIQRDWSSSDDQTRAFLREAHGGACNVFTTVLGPGSNSFHENHYHLDLARHGRSGRGSGSICKPVPERMLPAPPMAESPQAVEHQPDQLSDARSTPDAIESPLGILPAGAAALLDGSLPEDVTSTIRSRR